MNNLNLIKPFLIFDSEDDFYFVQIYMRKKEHKELGSNSYILKTYYITSVEHLESKMDEIATLCETFNARAYINLNKRSFEKLSYQLLKKISDKILNKDFITMHRAYNSVCGEFHNDKNKKWVVDLDKEKGQTDEQFMNYMNIVINDIKNCEPNRRTNKVLGFIPTKNGLHLITSPFNKEEFSKIHKIEIQCNNPTILYFVDDFPKF